MSAIIIVLTPAGNDWQLYRPLAGTSSFSLVGEISRALIFGQIWNATCVPWVPRDKITARTLPVIKICFGSSEFSGVWSVIVPGYWWSCLPWLVSLSADSCLAAVSGFLLRRTNFVCRIFLIVGNPPAHPLPLRHTEACCNRTNFHFMSVAIVNDRVVSALGKWLKVLCR